MTAPSSSSPPNFVPRFMEGDAVTFVGYGEDDPLHGELTDMVRNSARQVVGYLVTLDSGLTLSVDNPDHLRRRRQPQALI